MEGDNCQKPYKQRFKGVENFLRRIAFNLGNTPSQTEVKIISCIPIDVTDLQQKIINLEKQLYEAQQFEAHNIDTLPLDNDQDKENANNNDKQDKKEKQDAKEKHGPPTVVNTAFFRQSSAVSYSNKKSVDNIRSQKLSAYCGNCSSRQRKSNVSFVFPATPVPVQPVCASQANYKYEDNDEFEKGLGNELYKSIFRRRKKKKTIGGKNKIKTQLIYYAHESPRNPFHLRNKKLHSENDILSEEYLDGVVRRQYDPKIILEEFSDTSHFSNPVCRDIEDNQKQPFLYESDVCSCCCGRFQNLDNFMWNDLRSYPISPCAYQQNDRDETYYDSNFYDVVPVKENSIFFLKPDASQKKDYKRHLDMKCWPEKFRTKSKFHPFIVNYQTEIPVRRLTNNKHSKKSRVKHNRGNESEKGEGFETSKSCCIECSDIYTKAETSGFKLQKSEPTRKTFLRNKFVETDKEAIAQAFNQSTQSKSFPGKENKTDSTLDQIKSILQSVLQEVKTNSNINTVQEVSKHDAMIQKGSFQNNNPGNSTLLHTITYNNSCNTNPYLPPCSHQISSGQYCFSGMPYQPVKCLQNFPVFVHPSTGRPMCACYCRQSYQKTSPNKQATTLSASTNTDRKIQKSNSNETEKLIKEIYKSMALNVDYPTKENSFSESDDLKSIDINSIDVSNKKEKSTEAEILQKRDIEIEAMISPLVLNATEKKFLHSAANSQSENNRLTSDLSFDFTHLRKNNFDNKNFKEMELESSDTVDEMEEDQDESSDKTESDKTIVLNGSKKNEAKKKGLFKRMFNSVKLFKKHRKADIRKSESDDEQSEDSDSDDYQTILSGRSGKETPKERVRPNRRAQYSKIKTVIDHRSKRKVKRSPYLEQEYRRQWNENLMFHDQRERYSSEIPYSKPMTSQTSAQPVYWRNYEARRASVEHKIPLGLMTHQALNRKVDNVTSSLNNIKENHTAKGKFAWIKKHNVGPHCGKQWKKFILEN